MESENPLLLLLPLYLMTLNVSCEQFISLSIGLCQIWYRSNQPEIFLESKKSLKKYLTFICCIMYTSFQDSMDESGSRPNLGFGMNFESFILKLRNWSLVFQKEGK